MSEIKYYEDINIGDVSISSARTITEADVISFAGLAGDYNAIHTDEEFAKKTIHGGRIAHGLLTIAIASGLFTRTEYNTQMSPALLGLALMQDWKFPRAVKIGDTIHVRVEITEKVDTKPDRGRVTLHRVILNQRDEVVVEGDTIAVIRKRPK